MRSNAGVFYFKFRRVLLGNSTASEFYMPTFRNTVPSSRRIGMKDPSYIPAYDVGTECTETSAYKIQTHTTNSDMANRQGDVDLRFAQVSAPQLAPWLCLAWLGPRRLTRKPRAAGASRREMAKSSKRNAFGADQPNAFW